MQSLCDSFVVTNKTYVVLTSVVVVSKSTTMAGVEVSGSSSCATKPMEQ